MGKAYVITNPDKGDTLEMVRHQCQNEEKELQDILEKNPDLIPGDQIDQENPRRWMLIGREMSVQDPNGSGNRWNIDFLFADQDATPTFIECKRYADTRSRRAVIGQMFEYVANGQYYWTKEEFKERAEQSVKKRNQTLEAAISALEISQDEQGDVVDAFFEKMEKNLKDGNVRIIFFLEKAPRELLSLVEFLNSQLEKAEVLLVEAQQFVHEVTLKEEKQSIKIVVPMLWGFTEQARLAKRENTAAKSASRWNEGRFFEHLPTMVNPDGVSAYNKLYAFCKSSGAKFLWGVGKEIGSFTPRWPSLSPTGLFAAYSSGGLSINFCYLNGDEQSKKVSDRLKVLLEERVGLKMPKDYATKNPSFKVGEWGPKVDALTGVLQILQEEFRQKE